MHSLELKNILLLMIMSIMFIASYYIGVNLASTNFEEILFYSLSLDVVAKYGDNKPFFVALKKCFFPIVMLIGIFFFLFFGISDELTSNIYPLFFIQEHRGLIIIVLLVLSIIILMNKIGLWNYLYYDIQKSNLIKDNYVNPKNTKITFNKKRNLVMIFVESLENSLFSKEHGGIWDYEIINELYELLDDKDTVSFFDTNSKEGMHMLQGSSFTSSSVFANNSGIPIKLSLKRKGFSKEKYIGGIYNLGDLLKDNGYTNELISAANTTYGGFKEFYVQHGNYNIIDIDNVKEFGFDIKNNDRGNWGINDRCLFDIAKKRLDTLSKLNKPFNLQLVTIDTHFIDGYIGDYSETKFEKQYENVYATTAKLIKQFVDYIKLQPYYKDTTIVIVGDHLIMQSDFMNDKMSKNRTVYNCIINPKNKDIKNKKRIYTALDLYPTIVSSLGAEIKGNRLALGINLFSKRKTLIEKYGFKKLNIELKKYSKFYNEEILQIKK